MTRMRAEDRRRQLLAVAAEQFASKGYLGTTTAQLVEAAGVTPPILYRHFANKLELFVAAVEDTGSAIASTLETRLGRAGGAGERRRIALAFVDDALQSSRHRLIARAMTDADREPAIAQALRNVIDRLEALLTREVTAAQSRKLLDRMWGRSNLGLVPDRRAERRAHAAGSGDLDVRPPG